MSRRLSSRDKKGLGERLRQEAIDAWPAYSEALHNRILSAIERTKSEAAMPNRWSVEGRLRGRWMPAFAAACLVGVVVLGWQSAQRKNDQEIENALAIARSQFAEDVTLISGAPLIGDWADTSAEELSGMVVSAAVAPHSESLAHDTRLAAETLLERLPIDVEMFAGP
jgi:hypothetical protein